MAAQAVLVTGGTRGIGYATAQAFLAQGAHVAICGTNPESLRAAEHALEVLAVRADVRDPQQVQSFVEQARKRFGRVDVLVNNAGVAWSGDFADEAYESIARQIDVNVKGVLYTARAVLPYMLEQGAGVIINIASGAGLTAFAGITTYSATKFAVVGFTEALDQEVRDRGIRVYGVCPGRVATDMQQAYAGRKIGMPPEQVAKRIAELAGPKPRARTGSCVTLG
ncbi:3-ketoacyl-ACP reductase [Sulfurifustis variabilis]|uniref:3-ketoacyl-ACP reductase n=1 Tax=Sulfurifustis variabilis TaxID=1675686 RepID=A0A1B4V4F3_9GAMM|nr:SDR family oxidoreductase [Sulfurifustis variabilis]BAU47432.1 3-ketoacyl-ACP reductase [Sulfurifustis variabilis]